MWNNFFLHAPETRNQRATAEEDCVRRPTNSQTKKDAVKGSYTDHDVLSMREYKPSTSRFVVDERIGSLSTDVREPRTAT